jgi:hypothetical protein
MARVSGVNEGTGVFFFQASTTGLTLDSLTISADRNSAPGAGEEFRWIIQLGSNYYASEALTPVDQFNQVTLSNPSTLDWFAYSATTDITSAGIAGIASTIDFTNFSGAGWYFYADNADRTNLTYDVSEFSAVVIPEPSSFVLLLGGLGSLALLRRRGGA